MNPNKRPAIPSNGGDMPAVMCFMAGVAAVLMGYSVYSHLKTLHDRNNLPKKSSNKTGTKLEDCKRMSPNRQIKQLELKNFGYFLLSLLLLLLNYSHTTQVFSLLDAIS